MLKLLKVISISIISLVVVLLVAGYVVLTQVDFNSYKNQIVSVVKKSTGRDISLGYIKVVPSLNPTIAIENVVFANANWAKNKEMVSVDEVKIKLALIPLLQKNIAINAFVIKNAVVNLEEKADGSNNWTFDKDEKVAKVKVFDFSLIKEANAEEMNANSSLDIIKSLDIGKVELVNVKINYIDKSGQTSNYDIVNLNLDKNNKDGIDFDFNVNDGLYSGKGVIGVLKLLASSNGYPINADLSILGIKAQVDAKLYNALTNISFKANAKVSNFMGKNSQYNESVDLSVAGDLNKIDVNINEFVLANNVVKGGANINLAQSIPTIVASLSSDKVDISSFIKEKKTAFSVSLIKEAQATTLVPYDVIPYSALSSVNAQVDLVIKSIVNRDAVLAQNLKSVISVEKGVANFKILEGTIAGGKVNSDISLSSLNKTMKIKTNIDKISLVDLLNGLNVSSVDFNFLKTSGTDIYIDLTGHGDTFGSLIDTLDGKFVTIVGESVVHIGNIGKMTGNIVSQLFNTLNVTKGNDDLSVKCAVMRADFKDGVADIPSGIALNADKFTVVATGDINFKNDKLSLSVKPFAGKITDTNIAKALSSLVKLTGKINKPKIGIDSANAIKTLVGVTTAGPVYLGAQMLLESDGAPCYTALEGTGFESRFPKPKIAIESTTNNVGKVLDDSADLVKSTTEGLIKLLSGKKAK
jgi:uncharacterized protein involved in outer membrane biogenesis